MKDKDGGEGRGAAMKEEEGSRFRTERGIKKTMEIMKAKQLEY